jgi:argininosuccinate lyase
MPHKKNPDVFELVRAHCNRMQGLPNDIRLMTVNLPSGYFRDMQLLKELYLPAFGELEDCLDIVEYAVREMEVKEGLMEDPKYQAAFSVEEVNRLVAEDVPFRDAYRRVGRSVADGTFSFEGTLCHTHTGSVGNPGNPLVAARMDQLLSEFRFANVHRSEEALLGS